MKKLTIEEFIERSNIIHKNKYDYSLVDYNNSKIKVNIICPIHGNFEQIPNVHLLGNGCSKCGFVSSSNSGRKSVEEFINKAKLIHGDKYNYSKFNYVNYKTKGIIVCPIHGEFKQTPDSHITGSECLKCSINTIANKLKSNTKEFIDKAILIHSDRYDYSLVKYINTKTKVKIICPIHGEFEQIPNSHLRGRGCPICKQSIGEAKILRILIENNIEHISQKKFNDCKNIINLSFDFYLPKYNMCIEYDGIHHHKSIDFFGGMKSFLSQQERDNIKTEYCAKNNIRLLRIRYTDNVKERLKELFVFFPTS